MTSPFTHVTSKEFTLSTKLASTGSDTSITFTISETPNFTDGIVKVGEGIDSEWIAFTGVTDNSDGTYTFTGCTRGLDKDASSRTDNASASTNKKDHTIGTACELVLHSTDRNEYFQNDADTTLTGDNTLTGTNMFSSTSKASIITQNVTTVERDALTGVSDGAVLYDTTLDEAQGRKNGSWSAFDEGAVYENASETRKGWGEKSSVTDQQNATEFGDSNAPIVLSPEDLVNVSTGSSDNYKIAILDSSGLFDDTLVSLAASKFGGDGSDGDLTSGATISGSGYVVKNYSSMTPGANTIDVNGSGVILHIKCFGDCDLTNTTIDLSGHGATGGSGGTRNRNSPPAAGNAGDVGADGYSTLVLTEGGNYGSGGTSGAAGADAAANTTQNINQNSFQPSRIINVAAGGGGGGGGGGYNVDQGSPPTESDSGGDGGAGGGALILEVRGNLTLSSTTINCSGVDGSDGVDGNTSSPNYHAGGGGGGGAGGTVLIMYSGTLSGSVTPNVSGGSGGARGGVVTSRSGGGGGGGASLANAGAAGSTGAGGAGGNGESIIFQNTVFA